MKQFPSFPETSIQSSIDGEVRYIPRRQPLTKRAELAPFPKPKFRKHLDHAHKLLLLDLIYVASPYILYQGLNHEVYNWRNALATWASCTKAPEYQFKAVDTLQKKWKILDDEMKTIVNDKSDSKIGAGSSELIKMYKKIQTRIKNCEDEIERYKLQREETYRVKGGKKRKLNSTSPLNQISLTTESILESANDTTDPATATDQKFGSSELPEISEHDFFAFEIRELRATLEILKSKVFNFEERLDYLVEKQSKVNT